jgi:hypothetical protein
MGSSDYNIFNSAGLMVHLRFPWTGPANEIGLVVLTASLTIPHRGSPRDLKKLTIEDVLVFSGAGLFTFSVGKLGINYLSSEYGDRSSGQASRRRGTRRDGHRTRGSV